MRNCDHCGAQADDLYCTGCGGDAHNDCDYDARLGNVCGDCWAYLSHVEHSISCASGCACREDYPQYFDAEEEEDAPRCACGSTTDVRFTVPTSHGGCVSIPPTCAECLRNAEDEYAAERAEEE